MQISATNLLIAAQQPASARPAPPKPAAFAPEPFDGKAEAAPIAPAKPYGRAALPGAGLDISV